MAFVPCVGSMGSVQITRDSFLTSGVSKWRGNPHYSSVHFVELPVSGADDEGGVKCELPREIRNYENPLSAYGGADCVDSADLFKLEKKYFFQKLSSQD